MNGPLPFLGLFLQEYPGNLTYHLILLFFILAVIVTTAMIGRNSRYLYTRQMRLGLQILFGIQMAMLLGAVIAWAARLDARLILPPLDRCITAGSLVWISWLWLQVQPEKRITVAAVVLSTLLVVLLGVTLVLWPPLMKNGTFNSTWLAAVWNGLTALLCAGAAGFIIRKRHFQWYFGFVMFLLVLASSLLQFTPAGKVGDYPGFIRFGLLAAFPLLLFTAQRLFPPPLNEITKAQALLYGDRRRYSAELSTLQDWLQAASHTCAADIHPVIARAAAKTLLADFCYLLPLPGEGNHLVFLCGFDTAHEKELPGVSKSQSAFPAIIAAVNLAEPLIKNTGPAPDLELDNLADLAGLRTAASMLYIPLANANSNWGGLLFLTTRNNRAWSNEDITFGQGISQLILDLLNSTGKKASNKEEQTDIGQKEYQDLEAAFQQVLLQLSEFEQEMDTIQLDALAGFSEDGEDQAVGQELQLALTEMGHMQDQLTEAHQKLADLETNKLDTSPASQLNKEAFNRNSRKILDTLDSLKGKTDLLITGAAGGLTPVQLKFLSQVKNDSDRIQLLIEDLFSNAMEDSQSAFDLVEVIDLAVAETRTDFQAKNCSLYLNVDKTIPSIAGSSEPFKRILCQLMHNAIAASQPGGMVQLDARLDMAEDQQILLVEVTDSGEGILPEDLDKVFLAPDNGEDIQVSGLGDFPADLQVTRSLVESLGGEISVESAVGEGTTFHISLPVDFAGQGFVKDADEDQG